MSKKIIFLVLFSILLASFVFAQNNEKHSVTVYFFYGEECPHCETAKPFLRDLENKYPELTVNSYEVWHNRSNSELFISMSSACGTKVVGVPTFFIGHKPIIGFDSIERKGREIEKQVLKCIKEECVDLMEQLGINLTFCPAEEEEKIINLPIFGSIDTKKISLPLFTIIIAGLDGFNPCAIWVLCFLLTLLVHARSRKKMLLIGSIFVFFSAFVYFLFMTAWLNFFLLIGYVNILKVIIAIIAIIAGLINTKDFFWFKKGVSLTIPESAKPKLFEKMRALVHESALPAVIVGTIVLAFTANIFELLCTAGFPAIYARVLTLKSLPTITYYSYLVLYNIVYVIPLVIIVGIFVVTMGARRFTEKQGRWLKLIGGLLMLSLGLMLLIKPELLMFG